jgi:aspartate racemase
VEKTIGIVAGAGPFAGLDLYGKILDQTAADRDQDHLTIVSISKPRDIQDRTRYLLGQTTINPAGAIVEQARQLEKVGAEVAGIPCNTAHAAPIFDAILAGLTQSGSQILFLNMIAEVARFLGLCYPHVRQVGVLATIGTYRAGLYPHYLKTAGLEVIIPDDSMQESLVHPAIYDPVYGIKACGIATQQAVDNLRVSSRYLRQLGAEAIILGCTEIPIAITETHVEGMVVIDPTLVLARALIREANPDKLKPLDCDNR